MKSFSTPIQSFFGLHWAFFAQKCPFFTLIQLLELTRRTKHRWIWMNSMSIVYLFRPVKKSFLTPHSIMFWPYWAFFLSINNPFILRQLLELTSRTTHWWIWMKPISIVHCFEPVPMRSVTNPYSIIFWSNWAFFAKKNDHLSS